jgi:hypothetical protein
LKAAGLRRDESTLHDPKFQHGRAAPIEQAAIFTLMISPNYPKRRVVDPVRIGSNSRHDEPKHAAKSHLMSYHRIVSSTFARYQPTVFEPVVSKAPSHLDGAVETPHLPARQLARSQIEFQA